jgi:hypothetical protein
MAVCAGVFGLPWMYWTVVRNYELVNPWIMFNVPDNEIGMYHPLHVGLTILAVALIVLATATAILCLLPSPWRLRKSPLSNRTWPAYATTFLFLTFWFCQSVMPYRIPGALDYSDWPILQILHVEKRGLQFHETSVSVYRRGPLNVSRNDRRLLQYRFQQKRSESQLPQDLMQRVHAMVQSSDYAKRDSTVIKPLRAWNAEGWYFLVERSGIHSYTTERETTPPQEMARSFTTSKPPREPRRHNQVGKMSVWASVMTHFRALATSIPIIAASMMATVPVAANHLLFCVAAPS